MSKIDNYINALETLSDGRYHYWDGSPNSIGCSEFTRQALIKAGIINTNESFHAASGYIGVLGDTTRFEKVPWSAGNLQRGDILWSNGHHVATWDGYNGVYEASPESTHGICDNGVSGVGRWSSHTYYNCGTGTKTWTCIYRIIDELSKENTPATNLQTLAEFLPIVKYGSSGNAVKALQSILKKYGWYSDAIDGQAGPNTVKGIKMMQTAFGFSSNGIVDNACWTKLLQS